MRRPGEVDKLEGHFSGGSRREEGRNVSELQREFSWPSH